MARDVCPNCGADLPRKARACPECGADEKTGWNDDAHASGLDLPDDDFDYDEFVKNEFGEGRPELKPKGLHWVWWLTGVVLLGGLLLLAFSSFFSFGRFF